MSIYICLHLCIQSPNQLIDHFHQPCRLPAAPRLQFGFSETECLGYLLRTLRFHTYGREGRKQDWVEDVRVWCRTLSLSHTHRNSRAERTHQNCPELGQNGQPLALINDWMWVASERVWPWMRQLSAAEAIPEATDSQSCSLTAFQQLSGFKVLPWRGNPGSASSCPPTLLVNTLQVILTSIKLEYTDKFC